MSTTVSFTPTGWGQHDSEENGNSSRSNPKVPRRRRPWLVLVAAGLLAVAAVGNYVLISSIHERVPMLVLSRDVSWGQRVTPADVTTVKMLPNADRFAVPATARDRVLGRVAAENLTAGDVLNPGDVTAQTIPGAGQRVVGLRLKPGQFPAGGLAPNDPVRVVPVAEDTGTPKARDEGGFRARVVRSSRPDAEGAITVDVLIDADQASRASAAAAGDALVMLLGPQR